MRLNNTSNSIRCTSKYFKVLQSTYKYSSTKKYFGKYLSISTSTAKNFKGT